MNLTPLRIFIPSKGRSKTISTHLYLPENSYKIILHNREEKKAYLKNKTIPPKSLIVSGQPFSLAKQRNWIKDNLVSEHEWFVHADDNIHGFHLVPETYYEEEKLPILTGESRKVFESNIVHYTLIEEKLVQCIYKANKIRTGFIGFAKSFNYFFRRDKWKTVAIVCHKFCLIKKDHLRWNEKIYTLNDKSYSAECLRYYGKILTNNYIYPMAQHNEAGGLGTLEERIHQKIRCAKVLMKEYPGLFSYFQYEGCPENSDVRLKIHSEKGIQRWVQSMESS